MLMFNAQRVQAFETEREMGASFVAGNRMDFIDDHRSHRRQHRAAGIGTEQHIERFRRGDEDMRRPFFDRVALLGRGVTGAHRCANFDGWQAQPLEFVRDAGKRFLQVHADIVGKCL
jgi:hypothetical protein